MIPRLLRAAVLLIVAVVAGCASRPINPKLEQADPAAGYRADGHHLRGLATDTLIVVAFSVRAASAFPSGNNQLLARAVDVPDIELCAIDVSFAALPDPIEREYLNSMTTSFSLTEEQVDHLRTGARTIIRDSPEYKRLVRDMSTQSATPAGKVPAMLQ